MLHNTLKGITDEDKFLDFLQKEGVTQEDAEALMALLKKIESYTSKEKATQETKQ